MCLPILGSILKEQVLRGAVGKEQEADRSTWCFLDFFHSEMTYCPFHSFFTDPSKFMATWTMGQSNISSTRRPVSSLSKCAYRKRSGLLGTRMQSAIIRNVHKYGNPKQTEKLRCLSLGHNILLYYSASLHLLSYLK